jgi:hypothetical protein
MKEGKTKKYSDVAREKVLEGVEEGKKLARVFGVEESQERVKSEQRVSKKRVESEQKVSKIREKGYTGYIRREFVELAKELGMSVTDLQIGIVSMIKIMRMIMKTPP